MSLKTLRQKIWPSTVKNRAVIDDETGEVIADINSEGAEVLDPTPLDPPLGYVKTLSLHEQIREMVRSERLAAEVAAAGYDTFEEDDDFDVDDDTFDPSTPYENNFDPAIKDIHRDVSEHFSQEQKNKEAGDQPAPVTKPAKPAKSAEPAPSDPPSED